MATANAGKKQGNGRFKPGQSGNPAGKPKGTRHKATMLAQHLLDGEVEGLVRKVIELALAGDSVALRLCLERLVPPTKDHPIKVKLPAVKTAGQAALAMSKILESVAKGQLSPSEGQVISGLLEGLRKALEVEELEKRVAELEACVGTSN